MMLPCKPKKKDKKNHVNLETKKAKPAEVLSLKAYILAYLVWGIP